MLRELKFMLCALLSHGGMVLKEGAAGEVVQWLVLNRLASNLTILAVPVTNTSSFFCCGYQETSVTEADSEKHTFRTPHSEYWFRFPCVSPQILGIN